MASLLSENSFTTETHVALNGLHGDVLVPPIACGAWSWGDKTWNYDESKDLPGVKEVWSTLSQKKMAFYDTAEVYGMGESEKIMGRLIIDMSEEERGKLIVATKWFPVPIFLGRIWPVGPLGALRNSLARLNLKSVELYQVHAHWTYFYSLSSVAKALAQCVKEGLAKTIGVSNYNEKQMREIVECLKKEGVPLASNQIEFSLLRRLPETSGLLAACHELQVIPLAYSPLGQGRLTGKFSVVNPPPKGRVFSNFPMEELEPLLEVMRKISTARDIPMSAIALNWVLCKGAIPLGGARNKKQAEQNLQCLGWKLTRDEVAELDELAKVGKVSLWQSG